MKKVKTYAENKESSITHTARKTQDYTRRLLLWSSSQAAR